MVDSSEATGRGENAITPAAGVSLTRPEAAFLERLIDPFAPLARAEKPDAKLRDKVLDSRGAAAGLRPEDIDYIREWVLCQGVHWLSCESADLELKEGTRVFRNPAVRRIINAAAEKGFCRGTSALKEELEDFFTQRMRSPFLPEAVRDNAADKVAKLKGFYPDAKSAATAGAAVQIVISDPYGRVEARPIDG